MAATYVDQVIYNKNYRVPLFQIGSPVGDRRNAVPGMFVVKSEADPTPLDWSTIGGGGGGGAVTIANGADATLGAIANAAWTGTGDATLVSVAKLIALAQGLKADSAWTGSGDATLVAALKLLALTLGKIDDAEWSETGSATAISLLKRFITRLAAATVSSVADGAADSGNPLKVGGRVTAGLSGLTLLDAADRGDVLMGKDHAIYVRPHAGLEDIIVGNPNGDTTGNSIEVIAAQAGKKVYLTDVSIVNMHASTTAYVELKSDTTVRFRLPVPPGGVVKHFGTPLSPTAANVAWNFDANAAVTTLYYSAVGFLSGI